MDTNPLPYSITFAILFLILLGILTWVLDVWYKQNQCALEPNIWCSDNWTCNNTCPTGLSVNECFINSGSTGLASCLYGPNAPGARICFNTPSGTGGLSCNCPTNMTTQTNNCFSGCPQNLRSIPSNANCCCNPSTPGCITSCPTG